MPVCSGTFVHLWNAHVALLFQNTVALLLLFYPMLVFFPPPTSGLQNSHHLVNLFSTFCLPVCFLFGPQLYTA